MKKGLKKSERRAIKKAKMNKKAIATAAVLASTVAITSVAYADDGYDLNNQSIALEADKYITNTIDLGSNRKAAIRTSGESSINTGDYTLTAEASGATGRNVVVENTAANSQFTFIGKLIANATSAGNADARAIRTAGANTSSLYNGNIKVSTLSNGKDSLAVQVYNGSQTTFQGDLTDLSAKNEGTTGYTRAVQVYDANGAQLTFSAEQANLFADGGGCAEGIYAHHGKVYVNENADITAQNGSVNSRGVDVLSDTADTYDSAVYLNGKNINITVNSGDTEALGMLSSGSHSIIESNSQNLNITANSETGYAKGITTQYGSSVSLNEGTNTTINVNAGTNATGVVSQYGYGYPGHFTSNGNLTVNATGVNSGIGVYVSKESSFTADQITVTGTATGEGGQGIGAYISDSTGVVFGSEDKTSSIKGVSENGGGFGLYMTENESTSSATLKGTMTVEGSSVGIYNGAGTLTNEADLTVKNGIYNAGTFTNTNEASLTIVGAQDAEYGGAIYNEGTMNLNGTNNFDGFSATNKGGAIYNTGTLTIGNNSSFTGNKTTWDGAAGSGSEDTNSNGGAIWNSGTLTIGDNATFTDNHASHLVTSGNGHGADIYNIGGSVTIGDNLTITRTPDYEYKTYHDCGMFINGGTVNIGDNALIENVNEAIITSNLADVTIGDGLHIQNVANGIASWGNNVTVGKNATFENIIGDARAFQTVTSDGTFNFGDGLVVKNNMTKNFGNIYNEYYNTLMVFEGSSEFTNNSSQLNNVGVFQNLGSLQFKGDAVFNNNTAYNVAGAIRNRCISSFIPTITFEKSAEFNNNAALQDGGAIINQGTLTFEDKASFTGNIAGGLIEYVENEKGFFYDSETGKHYSWIVNGVNSESSNNGGALHNIKDVVFNGKATFTSNAASGSGAAIYNSAGTITFNDESSFTDNFAGQYGGAIYNAANLIFNASAEFNGNKIAISEDETVANDIFNNGNLTFNSITTLDGGISGNGVTNIGEDAVVTVSDEGTFTQNEINLEGALTTNHLEAENLNLSAGSILNLSNEKISDDYNLNTLNGTGDLTIDITKANDTTVSDKISAQNYSGLTSLTITDINDLTEGALTTEAFEVTVLDGYTGTGLLLSEGVTNNYSGVKLVAQSYSKDLVANTDWTNNIYGTETWNDNYNTGISVSGGNLIHTSVYTGKTDIVSNIKDTLQALSTTTQFTNRSMVTTDAEETYVLSADIGNMSSGSLTVKGASAENNTSVLNMNNNSGFVVGAGTTLNLDTVNVIGVKNENGSFINNTNGTVNLNNVNVTGEDITSVVNDATLNMTGNNLINTKIGGNGTTNIKSGLSLISNITQKTINILQNAQAVINGGNAQTVTNAGELAVSGKVTANIINNSGTLTASANNIDSAVANNGTYNVNGGTIAKDISGDGSLNLSGEVINNAVITQSGIANAGTLTSSADNVNAKVANAGTYNVTGGTIAKDITGEGSLYLTGEVINNAVITQSSITNNGTLTSSANNIDGEVANAGTYNVTGGTIAKSVTGDGSLNLSGEVINNAAITQSNIVNNDSLVNNAKITANITNNGFMSSAVNNIDGTVANAGTYNLKGDGTISNDITGEGTLNLTGEVINNAVITQSSIANAGTFTSSADNVNAKVENAGTYNVNGGTIAKDITGEGSLNLSGEVINNAAITQSGIANAGTLTSSADNVNAKVANAGTYNVTGGTIAKAVTGNGSVNIDGDVAISDAATVENVITVNEGKSLSSLFTNIKNSVTNKGLLKLNGSGNLTTNVTGNGTNSLVQLDSEDLLSVTDDNINDNIYLSSGTLFVGSDVTNVYKNNLTLGNGTKLDISNATANNVTNLNIASSDMANLSIDFEDTINGDVSKVSGNLLITDIDVSRQGLSAQTTLTTTLADKINLSQNVNLYRGGDLENTPNYVTLNKDGTNGILKALKSFLIDAIQDDAPERVYQQSEDETIVASEMTGNLAVKGSGQTVTSNIDDAGGGIQIGSETDTQNELKFTDISFDKVKVKANDKGVFTVEGDNKLIIEADEHDVSIKNTVGGSKSSNAIYLKGTDTKKSEAMLITKEERTIEIQDDIRSDNSNNRLVLTGEGEIKLTGVLDPLTVDTDAALVSRYNYDENILWNLNGGQLFYNHDSYLSGHGNSVNFNGGSLNLMNSEVTNIQLANLGVTSNSNIYVDVDAATQKMDTLSANTYNVGANLNVAGMNIFGTPVESEFETTFVDESTLGNGELLGHVTSSVSTVETGIYKYIVSYIEDGATGKFKYNVNIGPTPYVSYDSSVFASSVAMQGAYMSQLANYDIAFGNLDQTMLLTQEQRKALRQQNSYASNDETNPMVYSPLYTQNENKGIWFRPYASFEQVQLNNGPDVNNVMYGSLVGGDTDIIQIGNNGWEGQISVYAGYNGSHQTFEGNSIYQNGGVLGATAALYKGNFFTALTANVGASTADLKTRYGNNDLTMLTTGIASKTGYNWELCKGKLILQPSWTMSYTFLQPFNNFTNANGVRIENNALNAIQLAPGLKVIGNLPNGWQPYLGVNMRWNIMDDTKVKASYLNLPETSVKPYVEYGLGVQKMVGERFTGFGQAMFRGGGRNGVSFTFGFRWALGKDGQQPAQNKQRTPEKKKASISLNNGKLK